MAGRKQHYIPQVVQRAFEASRTSSKSQVFVFRKGQPEYLTSTEGSGAERDFYSNPLKDGKGALDDKITDFEGEHLTPILRALRAMDRGEVDAELAAIVVAHLAFRTAHLRGAMTTMVGSAVGQMMSIVEDPCAIRRFSGIDSMRSDSAMTERVKEELTSLGSDAWPEKDRNAIERIVIFLVRERFDDLVKVHANGVLRDGLAALEAGMPGTVVKAHARALSESLVPQERVGALRQLDWRVVTSDTPDRHFILPDCVVVASSTSANELKPLAAYSNEETAVVIMPLSSHQLLIGSSCAMYIDQADINLQLAKCSLDFFISSRQDEATRMIAQLIGEASLGVALDLFEEEDEAPSELTAERVPIASRLSIRAPVGKRGDAIKKLLHTVAVEALEPSTIDRIESVTVPANLRTALEAIWQRSPTADELQAAAYGTVELIKSGQEWKCRVIIPLNLAEMLGQTVNPERRLGAKRIVKMNFGRAYYIDCWAQRYPEIFDRPHLDQWSQIVSRGAFRAASNYFGGMAAARDASEPPSGGDAVQELASNLRLGIAGMREARQRFVTHRDVNQMILDAGQPIEFILVSTASVFGFLEAQSTSIKQASEAGGVLSSEGLWEWSQLLAKDLRLHYERRQRWSSEAELQHLGSHVERLFWTIGTIVSPIDGGHWIDVIDDERMALINRMLRGSKLM